MVIICPSAAVCEAIAAQQQEIIHVATIAILSLIVLWQALRLLLLIRAEDTSPPHRIPEP